MGIEEIWGKILDFNNKYFPNWKITPEVFLSNAMAGECGEVCNVTKHRAGGGTNKCNPTAYELLQELGDVFVYMLMLVERVGSDYNLFFDVIGEKLDKCVERMEKQRKEEKHE